MNIDISNIIVKSLNGSILRPDERQLLDDWLLDAANANEYAEVAAVWQLTGKAKPHVDVDIDAEWAKFKQTTAKHRVIRPRFAWIAAAAASVALLIGVFNIGSNNNIVEYASADGTEMFVLPDSSTVWLNRGSRIAYNYDKDSHVRTVKLSGEAMFKVNHTGEDFIVNTPQKVYTKVLGTTFNVKAYSKAKYVDLAVVEGRVQFGNKRSSIVVAKNQRAMFDCKHRQLMPTDSIDNNLIAWHTGQFAFNNKPITQVASQMGSYLNKRITLPDGSKNLQFTGSFDHPTSELFAEVVATAMNWNYTVSSVEIKFSKR